MFQHQVPAKIRSRFVGDCLADLAGKNCKDFVVRDESRLVAFKVLTGGAVGKNNACGLTGRCDANGRDIAAAMETTATVASETGFAEVRIDAGASEEFFWSVEQLPVGRRPSDDH